MTNAEAIKILEQIRQWTDYPKEALTIAIEALLKLELPSNLDDAAGNYAIEVVPDRFVPDEGNGYKAAYTLPDIKVAFKAGAEWMAGQGVTVKGFLYGGNLGIPDIPEEFYTDKEEEVIVQIRKK